MNKIKAIVTDIITKPKKRVVAGIDNWVVEVEYEDIGGLGITTLYFPTKVEAEEVNLGYEFDH